jgi:hypothetical protein
MADPAPAQDWNKCCAANGPLIVYVSQQPGPNTGWRVVADGAPNTAGQSIVCCGKTGVCHRLALRDPR